ncbi:hypothetical protein ACIBF1_32765 [Spirillospora sp. NPDC050679]
MQKKTLLSGTTVALAAAAALTGAAVPAHAGETHEMVGMYADWERCTAAGKAGQAAGKWTKWYCFPMDWGSTQQGLFIIREGSAKPRPAR